MFRGPGINSSDLSLLKNFSLGAESRTLQFRLEIYNTFNQTQFATLENVARFDAAGAQVNTRFVQYLTTRDGRRVQFGVKFNF